MNKVARRTWASWLLLAAMLLSLVSAAISAPTVAQAEGRQADIGNKISANLRQQIVYLDSNGYVRVLDILPAGSTETEIKFVSPEGGFRNLALGDFNGDGDKEIVAVKGSGPSDSVAVIYDPVVAASQAIPGQAINGIPWKQLARITLAARPETVATGNFDPNVGGDEIAVVRAVVAGESSSTSDTRVVIYKQTTPNGDGTNWTQHSAKNFGEAWERVSVGNITGSGGDAIALIESGVKVDAYLPDKSWQRIFEYGSDCRPPKDATFGRYFASSPLALLFVKKQNCSNSGIQPSFNVIPYNASLPGYNPDTPAYTEKFEPEPQSVFTGDITGNGDDEAVMIRNLPDGTTDPRRLFVRGNGNDQIVQGFIDGLPLDSDNGYREGAVGDIDGDGKGEIVIIRDNNIRVYPDANISTQAVNYPLDTNRRSIAIGNLAGGVVTGPQFGTDVASVSTTVNSGFIVTGTIQIQNVGTDDTVGYFAGVEGVNAGWLSVTPDTASGTAPGKSGGTTPIRYTINATGLPAGGTYSANIRIVSTGSVNVLNSPYVIPVKITVQTPPFEAIPAGATTMYYPCQAPLDQRKLQFTLSGVPGTRFFNALVLGAPQMAAAASLSGNTFLASQAADGTLTLTDATGRKAQVSLAADAAASVAAAGAEGGLGAASVSAASVSATNDVTFTSNVPWITSVSVPTTTLPSQMTLTIDPAQRTKNLEIAGLVLFGPSSDPNTPFVVRLYPIGLNCANWATWMPKLNR